jgi:hypothetical protein
LAVPTAAGAEDIHLACNGTATVERSEEVSVSGFDYHTGHTVSAQGTTTHREQVGAEVLVDITGDTGRIKLPPSLTPVVHSRSDQGWRQFSSLRIDDTQFRGRFSLNFINKPNVTINRVTGHIDIAAFDGSFSGECNAYDTTSGARKF